MTTTIAELKDELISLGREAREAGASAAAVAMVFQEAAMIMTMPLPPNAEQITVEQPPEARSRKAG